MTVIAVAGGTGGVGRAVVESILATQKYEVKIFSRKVLLRLYCSLRPMSLTYL